MEFVKRCLICGREYKLHKYDVKGHTKSIYIPDCDCSQRQFEEIEAKTKQDIQRHVKSGVFQPNTLPPLFERFNFENVQDSPVKRHCIEFARSYSKGRQGGFAFIGLTGCGKSVLLACVCQALASRGFSFLFLNTAGLLDRFIQSLDFTSDYKSSDIFKMLRAVDFVVLDDFGRDCCSKKRREFLFRVVEELDSYEKCVSISANPDVLAYLKSTPATDGIFDRLAVLCPRQYIFKGKSFRRDVKKDYFESLRAYEDD